MHSHIGLDPIIIYGDHLNVESEWASVLWKNAIVETRDTIKCIGHGMLFRYKLQAKCSLL
jgi:hypothetical protein